MAQGGERVQLHVYDLSQGLAKQLSAAFLGTTIEGIWHTGVVVYGTEYFFGGGIQRSPIGSSPYGTPLRVVELGHTEVPKGLFDDFLEEISPRFTPLTYKLMEHNCNTFSEEVCQFLVGSGIPEDILRLPQEVMSSPMGALIMPMIQNLETTLRNGGVPQVPHALASPSNFGNRLSPPQVSAVRHAPVPMAVSGNPSSNVAPGVRGKALPTAPAAVQPVPAQVDSVEQMSAESAGIAAKTADKDAATGKTTIKDPLSDARAKVQEEITREFAAIMAAGSVSASEAAALAAKRVMERHGTRLNLQSSQRVS